MKTATATRPKSPVIGYIVLSTHAPTNAGVLELCFHHVDEPEGILLSGDDVTLFATRARAEGAIRRTLSHVENQKKANPSLKLDWAERRFYKIQAVRKQS